MAASTASKHWSFTISLPSDREITMTRVFEAPRRLVFDAWTKPEHVKHWWGCLEGFTVPVCEIDLRPGGAWRFVNTGPDGRGAAFRGVYQEIARPDRLVYTEIFEEYPDTESIVTVTFVEQDGKTTLTCTSRYPSLEVRDMVLKTGMEEGAATSLDRLADQLATMG